LVRSEHQPGRQGRDHNLVCSIHDPSRVLADHERHDRLNGGPGCSSLDGFWHENGPAIWQAGTFLPVVNTYSWSNLTNIVFIEQPVGTGFSQGTANITSETELAAQFLPFWKNFVDLFDLQNRKVYITGVSVDTSGRRRCRILTVVPRSRTRACIALTLPPR
jgi:hypothetical protein